MFPESSSQRRSSNKQFCSFTNIYCLQLPRLKIGAIASDILFHSLGQLAKALLLPRSNTKHRKTETWQPALTYLGSDFQSSKTYTSPFARRKTNVCVCSELCGSMGQCRGFTHSLGA